MIGRLKSFTSTGARLHASPLSILAEIPLGPLDLMGLSAVKRSKTSSLVQRSSSGQSAEFIGAESSLESGGSAELKQLWKNKFRVSAFFLSSVIVSLLHDSVGMHDELFLLRALIAAQNCLGFLPLAMFST